MKQRNSTLLGGQCVSPGLLRRHNRRRTQTRPGCSIALTREYLRNERGLQVFGLAQALGTGPLNLDV